MPTLHLSAPARAGSHRRWATGAVIVATLLAEVPSAPDRTADRPVDDAPAPVCGGFARATAACRPRVPGTCSAATGAARPAGAALGGGTLGPSHRLALRHLIGL
ncbi:MAG TPA: hypothetical protein VHW23_35265 [Kofleriaceae bacterium]|jgi:hypothetical protein|nr:hypothetical protein [Kofleriaceae bacterium]